MSTWWQIGFPDSASPLITEFTFFHDYSILILIFITTAVLIPIVKIKTRRHISLKVNENQWLETAWTLLPGIILIQLAIPSLTLLYMLEEDSEQRVRVKALGHQWYWSYEIHEFNNPIVFDRYMEPTNEAKLRLLDVDNRLVLPTLTPIRILISSIDVLHSWTVPSLGVKADACPGRINQVQFLANRPGLFFGQCSEICGSNHRFIPIVVEAVRLKDFVYWAIRACE